MAKTTTVVRKSRKPANGNAKTKPAASVDRFGFRVGSKKSQAAAMYASKKGATLGEVKEALKSSQFNLLSELKERKVQIDQIKVPGPGARQVTRYHIVG